MPIENRNLVVGTRLVGSYRKEEYGCAVEAGEDGKLAYVLKDGRRYKSPSSAAGAVMDGKAVNGWLFWSLATDHDSTAETPTPMEAKPDKGKRVVSRQPNQRGVEEGWTRCWCNACMKGLTSEGTDLPATCPEGHTGEAAVVGRAAT